jgi:hypothetical protein
VRAPQAFVRDGVIGEAPEEFAECDPPLQPGDRGAEAEVRALSECQMSGRVAAYVEAVRVRPARLVPVGGSEQQQYPRAFRHRGAVDRDVLGERACHQRGRTVEAQHLFDRRRNQARIGEQCRALIRVAVQPVHGIAEQLGRRLVAGDQQQEAEPKQFVRGEPFTVLLCLDQHADEVVSR